MTTAILDNVYPITTKKVHNEPVRLTNKFISGVIPRQRRYAIKDSVVTGLTLHIYPSGSKRFLAVGRVRKANKVRTKTLGDASVISIEDARTAAREFLSHLQLGTDANEVRASELVKAKYQTMTLSDALELYVTDRELQPKTVKCYRYDIPKYCACFLYMAVNKITDDEVCQWYLANKHRPASIDKAFRSLRAILHYMIALKVISHNPCTAITARKLRYKLKPRTRRIETYNLTKFMDAWLLLMQQGKIKAVQGDFILWLLMTGCRLDEARTIKWSDIDNEQLAITILDTKNGHPHVLPLTPLMNDLLDRRKQENPRDNPYVFIAKQGRGYSDVKHLCDCRKSLDKIALTAKVPIIRPHDIRRTFTTILDELDISESNIKALLNHNDGSVTRKHYLQSTNVEVKRRNLWAVGKYLEQAITVNGNNPATDENCIYACVGSIREFVYGTAKCDYAALKDNEQQKTSLIQCVSSWVPKLTASPQNDPRRTYYIADSITSGLYYHPKSLVGHVFKEVVLNI
ncbi:MAG: tyrosine-type recombinase/integrase [Psychromonas sp.]|nr:tyrosine-type recombinase/integrase [Psychromonas sp.]